ncbi:pentapeptide repeat-containing protein [Nocardiopsis valliformis]|uniref:pentapeptide repeat-containing protein n=1 Tax=Nocardiopsis valliformis TaxID=239974 RepID=UPI000349DFB2|nr:pentapeptide repeat-containing protein [Nocardiopsis valliformis]
MREPLSLPHDPAAVTELLAWARGEPGHCLCTEDMRGADLSGFDMRWECLHRSDLRGCRFDRCDFTKAELPGSRFEHASFRGAWLRRTDFSDGLGTGADFSGAQLIRAYLYRAELPGALFRDAYTAGTSFDGADLRGADLREVCFGPGGPVGSAFMEVTRLHGCQVAGAEGWVRGTADVGPTGRARVLGGRELAAWFTEHGAPGVLVSEA